MSDAPELLARYRESRRAGRIEEATRALREAEPLCRTQGRTRDLVEVLKGQAQLARDVDEPAAALAPYAEAVALCRVLDDPLLFAHTVRHLADLYMELDRPDFAGPCFDEALAVYRSHVARDPLDHANAARPAALRAEGEGEIAAAIQLWTEARALYAEANVARGVAECERRLDRLELPDA